MKLTDYQIRSLAAITRVLGAPDAMAESTNLKEAVFVVADDRQFIIGSSGHVTEMHEDGSLGPWIQQEG